MKQLALPTLLNSFLLVLLPSVHCQYQFTLQLKSFPTTLSSHANNCSVSFNDQILIYCGDQSVYLDQYVDFLTLDSGSKAYLSLNNTNISAS